MKLLFLLLICITLQGKIVAEKGSFTNPFNNISEANKAGKYYAGEKAIKQVELREGPLSKKQKRVVAIEGFVDGYYKDHKGIKTYRAGQTGEFMNKGFIASYNSFEKEVQKTFKDYSTLPEYLQSELVQLAYRGDVYNPKNKKPYQWVTDFNEGKYKISASELINHDEYREYKSSFNPITRNNSIVKRIDAARESILQYGKERQTSEKNQQLAQYNQELSINTTNNKGLFKKLKDLF